MLAARGFGVRGLGFGVQQTAEWFLRFSGVSVCLGFGGVLEGEGCKEYWVLVKGVYLSYHNKETIVSTIDPHNGNLNTIP